MWGSFGNFQSLKSLTIRNHRKRHSAGAILDPDMPSEILDDPRWMQGVVDACPALEELALVDDALRIDNYVR